MRAAGTYPRQVLLPCVLEGQDALERLLTEAAGHKVALAVPQRGDKCRLTEMAAKNAQEEILIATTKAQRSLKTLEWLQRALELDAPRSASRHLTSPTLATPASSPA